MAVRAARAVRVARRIMGNLQSGRRRTGQLWPSVSSFGEPELDWLPRRGGGRCAGLRHSGARAPMLGVPAVSPGAKHEARGGRFNGCDAHQFQSQSHSLASGPPPAGRQAEARPLARHNHLGADVHAIEKINDVFVEHAYAPGRREGADGVRPVRSVDSVLLATGQRQRARTDRVSWRTARDHVRQPRVVAPDLVRRRPGGADMLAIDLGVPPRFASPAHADRIADPLPSPRT